MSKIAVTSVKDLKKIIKMNAKAAVNELAYEISSEIQKMYEQSVDDFYNHYVPIAYKRTYSTYLASSNFENSGLYKVNGNNYESGITVDPSNIPGSPYYNHWGKDIGKPMDTEWVFWRTFSKGIHGITTNEIRSMNKNRNNNLLYMRDKQNKIRLKNIKTKRFLKKKRNGYITIKAPRPQKVNLMWNNVTEGSYHETGFVELGGKIYARKPSYLDDESKRKIVKIPIRVSPEKLLTSRYKTTFGSNRKIFDYVSNIMSRYGFYL